MTAVLDYSPAVIVQRYLASTSVGTLPSASAAWPIGVNSQLKPDNTITVYDTEGQIQGRIQVTKGVVTQHGLQFRIRGVDQNTAYTKAKAILEEIDKACDETIVIESSVFSLGGIHRKGSIVSMGRETPDNVSRFLFSINALVTLEQLS